MMLNNLAIQHNQNNILLNKFIKRTRYLSCSSQLFVTAYMVSNESIVHIVFIHELVHVHDNFIKPGTYILTKELSYFSCNNSWMVLITSASTMPSFCKNFRIIDHGTSSTSAKKFNKLRGVLCHTFTESLNS